MSNCRKSVAYYVVCCLQHFYRFILEIHQIKTNYYPYFVDVSVSDRDRNVNKVRIIYEV